VQVPVTDDLAAFSGDYVLPVDRAWALVRNFILAGKPSELGEWRECNHGPIANRDALLRA
jgi:hypothetical protein